MPTVSFKSKSTNQTCSRTEKLATFYLSNRRIKQKPKFADLHIALKKHTEMHNFDRQKLAHYIGAP